MHDSLGLLLNRIRLFTADVKMNMGYFKDYTISYCYITGINILPDINSYTKTKVRNFGETNLSKIP